MWQIDDDHDGVFNYIDWRKLALKAWDRQGLSQFYEDYAGNTSFLKGHVATYNQEDLTFNWENPFHFYDPDGDGLTEYTIRLAETDLAEDSSYALPADGDFSALPRNFHFGGHVSWAAISFDADNDNGPERAFDFDFTVHLRGPGFRYDSSDRHAYASLAGLPGTDSLFYDPRHRRLSHLTFADRAEAQRMMFQRGKWDQAYFVFDEDDDCQRWERVELYEPLDPFVAQPGEGGISQPSQSDVSGDRGEWDLDASGQGQLYRSPLDGKLHLYGAEWGAWRVDQNAGYYQGWGGWQWKGSEYPERFMTFLYHDTDSNGFVDQIQIDLDGDHEIDETFSARALGLDDVAPLIGMDTLSYDAVQDLFAQLADAQWQRGQQALQHAQQQGLQTQWYALYQQAQSPQQRYDAGGWLSLYLYLDLQQLGRQSPAELQRGYLQGRW
jgi:hypothetical protein